MKNMTKEEQEAFKKRWSPENFNKALKRAKLVSDKGNVLEVEIEP